MKRIILMLALVIVSLTAFSQSQRYYDLKALYLSYGYTIGLEEEGYVSQGNSAFTHVVFKPGVSYSLVAMSDDLDVLDLDIYVYYASGNLYVKDDDNHRIAVVNFNLNYEHTFKIVVKNYSSNTPNYRYKVRYFVAYRY